MKILSITEIENCFDGTFMKMVQFDRDVTAEFIKFIGGQGSLKYYPDFPKAFYQIDCPDRFIVKGIEGASTAKLILYRADIDRSQQCFENLVNSYRQTETETTPHK